MCNFCDASGDHSGAALLPVSYTISLEVYSSVGAKTSESISKPDFYPVWFTVSLRLLASYSRAIN